MSHQHTADDSQARTQNLHGTTDFENVTVTVERVAMDEYELSVYNEVTGDHDTFSVEDAYLNTAHLGLDLRDPLCLDASVALGQPADGPPHDVAWLYV